MLVFYSKLVVIIESEGFPGYLAWEDEFTYGGMKKCPKCSSRLEDFTDDHEIEIHLCEVEIKRKPVKKRRRPLNLECSYSVIGGECNNNHRWARQVDKVDLEVPCPDPGCNSRIRKPHVFGYVSELECRDCLVVIEPGRPLERIRHLVPRKLDEEVKKEYPIDYYEPALHAIQDKKFYEPSSLDSFLRADPVGGLPPSPEEPRRKKRGLSTGKPTNLNIPRVKDEIDIPSERQRRSRGHKPRDYDDDLLGCPQIVHREQKRIKKLRKKFKHPPPHRHP